MINFRCKYFRYFKAIDKFCTDAHFTKELSMYFRTRSKLVSLLIHFTYSGYTCIFSFDGRLNLVVRKSEFKNHHNCLHCNASYCANIDIKKSTHWDHFKNVFKNLTCF